MYTTCTGQGQKQTRRGGKDREQGLRLTSVASLRKSNKLAVQDRCGHRSEATTHNTGSNAPSPPPSTSTFKSAPTAGGSWGCLLCAGPSLAAASPATAPSTMRPSSSPSPGPSSPRPSPARLIQAGRQSLHTWYFPSNPPTLVINAVAETDVDPSKAKTRAGGSSVMRGKGSVSNTAAAAALRGLNGSASIPGSTIVFSGAHVSDVRKSALTAVGSGFVHHATAVRGRGERGRERDHQQRRGGGAQLWVPFTIPRPPMWEWARQKAILNSQKRGDMYRAHEYPMWYHESVGGPAIQQGDRSTHTSRCCHWQTAARGGWRSSASKSLPPLGRNLSAARWITGNGRLRGTDIQNKPVLTRHMVRQKRPGTPVSVQCESSYRVPSVAPYRV